MSNDKRKIKFVLRDPAKEHRIKWPVRWMIPDEDGGDVEVGFTAHFKLLPDEEVDKLFGGGMFGRFTDAVKNKAGLREVLVNWSGVELATEKDAEPAEVPFSEAHRDMMLAWQDCSNALIRAYASALAGKSEKN
ncbi:MAG: hypothetical protein Q7V31_03785 [Parvibaculum sp.]|uniref:hypothetical protein n=1 Tax=Parvibaculum sp. TaxID=2024848 RepID=UPI002718ACF7|nr:hypothetical protein [Parvibaculum sp.]MDO8838024.1 hypothetical protein [Parvibaculum sp.]